jgi:hypothetical protein
LRNYRLTFDKVKSLKKKPAQQGEHVYTKAKVIIAYEYAGWQKKVLVLLRNSKFNDNNDIVDDWKATLKQDKEITPEIMKKSLQFGSFMLVKSTFFLKYYIIQRVLARIKSKKQRGFRIRSSI